MKIITSLFIAMLFFGATVMPQSLRAEPPTLPGNPGAEKPSVVMRMTGPVKAIGADTCMDGATYILTQIVDGKESRTRLKPGSEDVRKILAEAAISGSPVTAVGRMGSMIPQCSYLEVKSAELAKVVASKSP